MSDRPCKHPKALSLGTNGEWSDVQAYTMRVRPVRTVHHYVDRWCPECGAIRVMRKSFTATVWRKPQP